MECTLVLLKPDAVQRSLAGKIIQRFEDAGLKIVGMKMVWVNREHAIKHYPATEEHMKGMGEKTLKTYAEYGLDPLEYVGTKDPLEIGKIIRQWNADFISCGPVIAIVFEGNHAIDNVRKLVGNTIPTFANPGTIRGDFSTDSPALANMKKRTVKNLVHASGDKAEAEREIAHWFSLKELHSYKTVYDFHTL